MKFTGKTQVEVDQETLADATERCRVSRLQAYRDESDPLFFDYQKGVTTKEAWLAKVAEIKARYPKP